MKKTSLNLVLLLTIIMTYGNISNSPASPLNNADSLVAFYPFNGNANDESGNGNNPIYIGAGVTLTSDRFDQLNKAYYFNGNDSSYIRIPADNFPTTDRTISFWFYTDQLDNHPTPLSYGGEVCYNSFILVINKGDFPNSYTALAHCGTNYISAPYSVPPINNWYFLTMTISGATQKIFINGELQQIANTFSMPTVVAGKSVILGALIYTDGNTVYTDPTAGAFQGKLDDFRFYNSAMTDSQVMNLYKSETSGLIAYFPFNGNAVDESGFGHDGTVLGGILTTDRNNVPNKAYTFPNLHNQIVLSNSSNLILSEGFTLNTWIKYKNINCGIVGKHNCWFPNGFLLGIEDGQFTLWISNGGWQIIKTNETYLENKWYMVTAVYDSINNTGLIYIDGKLKAMGTAIYTNFNTASITISEASDNCPSGNMPGTIDEVKIFDRPLTATEILSEYYSTQIGLVAFYPFNGNANDASGNLNHGVVNGAVLTNDRYGIADKAYYFDGGNSYIEGINPGNNLPVGSQQRTISCWVQSTESIGDRNIFHYGTTEIAPTNYHLFLNLGNHAGIGNGYGYGTLISSTGIGDNTWHFVTGVYEGESTNLQHIFIDGKLDVSASISTTPNTVLSSNWKMGQFMSGSQSLMGKIDDLRVFNIALNDQEIKNLYLTETTAPVLLQPANQTMLTTLTPIMQWNISFTNAEYKFQLASDSVFTELLYETTTNNSSVQLPEGILAVGIAYSWRVRTTLNGEAGPWSEVWTFTYVNTGIQEAISGLPSLTVTPNPADLYVKLIYSLPVDLKGQKPVIIEIVNSIGKPLAYLVNQPLPPGIYETRFDTRRMEPGIYFCRLKAGNHALIRKLIVMH